VSLRSAPGARAANTDCGDLFVPAVVDPVARSNGTVCGWRASIRFGDHVGPIADTGGDTLGLEEELHFDTRQFHDVVIIERVGLRI